ncbi:MAG: DUF1330 domain-containing protein [Gammaproteobacteria bacterium]
MSAYMIVHATVKNSDNFKKYSESAGPTLKLFGAEVMFKGKVSEVLTGDHQYKVSAVMKFPDTQAISNWYNSKEYQSLIPLRETAADVVFVGVQE